MADETFNGHTNWDTWNASLWLSNEEFTYKECRRIASRSLDADRTGQAIREFTEELGLTGDGFDPDKVDWDSIGEEYYNEVNEEE